MVTQTSFNSRLRLALVAPIFVSMLAACGGGSDGSSTVAPPVLPSKINPEGIWHGYAKSASNELIADVLADGTGSAYALLNTGGGLPSEALYLSGFTVENFTPNNLVSSGFGYYRHVSGGFYESIGSAAMTVQSGTTQKNLQFQVSPNLSGGTPRTVTLTYDSQYDKQLDLNAILGNYRSKNSANTIYDLSISSTNPNAMLTSSNPACVFSNSRISSLNNSKNVFSVVGIFSGTGCGFQGAVMGTAFAELGNDGQVNGINIALRASNGSGFYAFQGKKN